MKGVLKGHMARALRQVRRYLDAVDVVIEVADARAPFTSRSGQIASLVAGRAHLLVLTRDDLADPDTTQAWLAWFRRQGIAAETAAAADPRAPERLRRRVVATAGNRPKPRAMVVGLPNVGKSTLLNRLAGRRRVRTGPEPGVTRGKQWVDLGNLWLLDMPGVLPPRLGGGARRLVLGTLGLVGPEVVTPYEAAVFLIGRLGGQETFRQGLRARFRLDAETVPPLPADLPPVEVVLDGLARRRGLLRPGGEPDRERAAHVLMAAFREGGLGRLSLEHPRDLEEPAPGGETGPAGDE
ncbi:MAG: GTP-binding protein HSR1 [Bacillota bacterium]|nr:MAG: GTP-binding protein HSR1 [Bacillota bacterium]